MENNSKSKALAKLGVTQDGELNNAQKPGNRKKSSVVVIINTKSQSA